MEKRLAYEAKDEKLEDVLFSQNKKFRVPRYQRPYTWGEDQVSDMWLDMKDESYNFIGSLIFNLEHYDKTGYYDIIDGQQRLITITILCAVLRDIAKPIDKKFSDLIHRQDIAIEDRDGNESFRIVCSDSLKIFFEDYIQKPDKDIFTSTPRDKEAKLVKANYEYFTKQLNAHLENIKDNSKKIEYLKSIRTKIQNTPIIRIYIHNEDDAYNIFETTNARGVDLSVADLLKNMIFDRMRDKGGKDTAKELWEQMVSNVQNSTVELKKFIRYYWISKHPLVSEKKLYKKIKNETANTQDLLVDLVTNSEWFYKLYSDSQDQWEGIKSNKEIYTSIQAVKLMDVSQCHVLFLCLLRNINKLGTDPKKIFQMVEAFSFKYSAICKMPGNKLEKIYSNYANKIEDVILNEKDKQIHKRVQQTFEELKKDLKKIVPGYEQFKESFVNVSYGKANDRMLIKYILSHINYLQQPPEFSFKDVSIEHLLPQNPDKEWGLKAEYIKEYVHKIGNLTLLNEKLNQKALNKIMKEKVKELGKSSVRMTLDIVEQMKDNSYKWDKVEIEKRTELLADIAYNKVWLV